MFDLTPGWEMFEGFAKDSDGWKKFFQDYSDRLVYGTDICDEKGISILDPLRRCLETDEVFEKSGVMCYGLKLPDDILKKIYRENYQTKIHSEGPGQIQMDILEKYKNNLEKYMETLSPEKNKEAQKETDKI